jgi:DNA-binding transcriptional LysR family regulator
MDWNLLRLFVEVVDAGSMSEVARRRGITRSSVSQRMNQLEQDMCVQLLRRSTRALKPTEIGRTLYEHGCQIAYQVEAAQNEVQSLGTTLSGLVRISLPPGIGHSHIQPALIDFAGKHPDLALNVTFNNRLADMLDAEVDIALRIMPRPPDDVVARELSEIDWQLYCTPDYLERCGPLETPADLRRAAFLTTFGGRRVDLALDRNGEAVSVTLTPRLVSESVPFLRDAMLCHLGVAQLSNYIVRDLVDEGRVVPVLPGYQCVGYNSRIYILTPPNRFQTPAMAAVIEFLAETVAAAVSVHIPST